MKLKGISGGEHRYCCIFCGETKGKLYVNWKKGKFFCFRCQQGGPTKILQNLTGVTMPVLVMDQESRVARLPDLTTSYDLRGSAAQYLRDHQIPVSFALKHGVRSGTNGLSGRIVFRVFKDGVMTFATAHACVPWIWPKTFHYGAPKPWIVDGRAAISIMYFQQFSSKHEPIILVEGGADALRTAYVTHSRAAALWGQNLTDSILEKLEHEGDRFIVMLDGGLNEARNALRIVDQLQAAGHEATIARLPEGKDPCQVTGPELLDVWCKARDSLLGGGSSRRSSSRSSSGGSRGGSSSRRASSTKKKPRKSKSTKPSNWNWKEL